MAFASRDLRSHVTDVVTCPICLELFNSPKSLPCLHTFCLKCIEGHCRDNEPGDEILCPVCRQKFWIPESGVQGLVSNFFIVDLVEARKTASDVVVPVPCEVCFDDNDEDGSHVAASTMYCVDCNQKLCEQCCKPHRKMKGGPHTVVPIGTDVESVLIQVQGGKCDKHKNECVKLFCFDCQKNICFICFAEEHKQHNSKSIEVVAEETIKQMDEQLVTVKEKAGGARNEISRLSKERRKFVAGIEDIGRKILTEGKKLKNLVDKQVDELLYEVQSLKTEKCKEIECQKENVEMKLVAFETFNAYCSELKSKGKPCDITRAANGLHIRATELLQNDVTLTDYNAPVIKFKPMNIHELLAGGHNIVGVVGSDKTSESNKVSSAVSLTTEQQLSQSVETERCLRQQIEVCNSQLTDNINTWTQKVNELQEQVKQLKEREIKMKADKEIAFFELTFQYEQLRNTERELRLKLGNSEKDVNGLTGQLRQLRRNESELKIKLMNCHKLGKDIANQREELNTNESHLKSRLETSEKSMKMFEGKCEQLRKNEVEMRRKLENSETAMKKSENQLKQLQASESEMKVELGKSENMVKSLNEQLEALSKCEASLKEEANQVSDREQVLEKHLPYVAPVVHTLPEAEIVCGVTSLDDELYVVRRKAEEQIEVYNTTTTTTTTTTLYTLLRHLSVPGLKGMVDMTSCKHYRCLYISDYISKCVHRVELNGKVTKWSVNNKPFALSVTSQFTVIVTCRVDSKLLELTTEGKQLREINLQSDIVNPWHAIQLSNGQFVVCHGWYNDPVHRVCIVDTNGHVTQSYGGPPGSATVGQLNGPVHLAVDKDEFIFVADYNNSRVFLLSPTLSFVREIVSRDQFKWLSRRLFLDVDRRRLYIAENEWKDGKYTTGRVAVVQL